MHAPNNSLLYSSFIPVAFDCVYFCERKRRDGVVLLSAKRIKIKEASNSTLVTCRGAGGTRIDQQVDQKLIVGKRAESEIELPSVLMSLFRLDGLRSCRARSSVRDAFDLQPSKTKKIMPRIRAHRVLSWIYTLYLEAAFWIVALFLSCFKAGSRKKVSLSLSVRVFFPLLLLFFAFFLAMAPQHSGVLGLLAREWHSRVHLLDWLVVFSFSPPRFSLSICYFSVQ